MGMNFGRFARGLGPIMAIGLAAALAGCDGSKVTLDGEKGKPLEELDLTGAAPTGVALLGPDSVRITRGDKLAIKVDGDPDLASAMRFTLKDGTLGILRKEGSWSRDKTVSVNVTLPALSEVAAMGSGSVIADRIGGKASVSIGGSGSVETTLVEAESLEISIAGSGSYRAGGQTRDLELSIAGSGSADMDGLKADKAEVSIAGSGNARFASDGKVKASMVGSGEVRVKGRATCTVSAVGSGKLVCENGAVDEDAPPPTPPAPPPAPEKQ
jgi:hypothetical protein